MTNNLKHPGQSVPTDHQDIVTQTADVDSANTSADGSTPQPRRRQFTFDRVVRMVLTLLGIIAAVWVINRLSDVLLPFLVAWLVAYLLEPFVQMNRRLFRLKGRIVAILLTLFETVLVFTVLGIIFVPWIIDEFHTMSEIVHKYTVAHADVPLIPEYVHDFLRDNIDFKALSSELSHQDLQSIGKWALNMVAGGVNAVIGMLGWLIVLLYVVFIMIDYDRLLNGARNLVPPRYRKVVFSIADDVQNSMNHYFRGQALVSLCVGILFSIGFVIIGLPLGVVLGLFIGLLNMVPYLQLISLVPTTLLCLVCAADGRVDFWTVWLECMALYCICQAIQDLFLTPKIMGKYMGLNPAIILLSLSIWGSLLGLVGLIIALPLTTLVLSYYDRYIIRPEMGSKAAGALEDATLTRNG